MTLHQIVAETIHVTCVCGASRDAACTPGGVHYARLAHARRAGLISLADFASAIHDADRFGGLDVLLDPEVAA